MTSSPAEHPAVAQVLASLDTLDALDPADHVAVFEQAHQSLRRVLRGTAEPEG